MPANGRWDLIRRLKVNIMHGQMNVRYYRTYQAAFTQLNIWLTSWQLYFQRASTCTTCRNTEKLRILPKKCAYVFSTTVGKKTAIISLTF